MGALLGIAGGIGIHRFPDFYSRSHAVGITDTSCAAAFLIGLGLHTGFTIASLKLLLIFIFLFFSSPTSTHALANAAHLGGAAYLQLSTGVNYPSARKRQIGICRFDAAAVNTAEGVR